MYIHSLHLNNVKWTVKCFLGTVAFSCIVVSISAAEWIRFPRGGGHVVSAPSSLSPLTHWHFQSILSVSWSLVSGLCTGLWPLPLLAHWQGLWIAAAGLGLNWPRKANQTAKLYALRSASGNFHTLLSQFPRKLGYNWISYWFGLILERVIALFLKWLECTRGSIVWQVNCEKHNQTATKRDYFKGVLFLKTHTRRQQKTQCPLDGT